MLEFIILEVGTNDFTSVTPEVVGSSITDLVVTLKCISSVAVACLPCYSMRRIYATFLFFRDQATVLQQYLDVVLDPLECLPFCKTRPRFLFEG